VVGRGSPWAGDGERRCSDGDGRGGAGTGVRESKTIWEREREVGAHIVGREMEEMSSVVRLRQWQAGPIGSGNDRQNRLPAGVGWAAGRARGSSTGPRGEGSSARPRLPNQPKTIEGREKRGGLGGLRRGPKRPGAAPRAKRPVGDGGRGFGFFLFSI
jgi:hypothetical protein